MAKLRKADPELKAISAVLGVLDELETLDQKVRVIAYVAKKIEEEGNAAPTAPAAEQLALPVVTLAANAPVSEKTNTAA